MEINKKDVETLANAHKFDKVPKKYKNIGIAGLLTVFLGGILFLLYYSWALSLCGAGFITFGIASFKQSKLAGQYFQDYVEYYERTGKLPPVEEKAK